MKQLIIYSILLTGMVTFSSCLDTDNKKNTEDISATYTDMDIHSHAKPTQAVIKHLSLDLNVDFDTKKLSGTAAYDIQVNRGADSIILDVRNLDIQEVWVGDEKVMFTLGPDAEWIGQALIIPVKESSTKLSVKYSTRPDAEALQWLVPSQTAGKEHPYLFTQGQAILTRTWIPIQDSPGIRLTYHATVRVPKELMAVMSASNPMTKNEDGVYKFEMNQPIPAYLIALAVGDLAFKSVGARTGVYTEPSMLEKSANELSDMEKMVELAESLYGPYQWERYDVIVLPPSFPFGGMENPRLTFATPTIIAGDKSLVSLIAHELAHSWSGNLVTNATWNDFWLNEGFTVYFEQRIMEELYDSTYSDMLANLSLQELQNTISELDPKETHLYLDLKGRNPDDGMNDIAYVKGANFLKMIEQKVGRPNFDGFLRQYFANHKFQSMTTERFIIYLQEKLLVPNNVTINIDEWVYGPGLPSNYPKASDERFVRVNVQLDSFLRGSVAQQLSTRSWGTFEWLHFLRSLPDSLTSEQVKDLDTSFGFTKSPNSEIKAAWYKFAINQGYGKEILPDIRDFLVNVGRRKFLTPLYTALIENGMVAEAKSIYAEAKPNYHSVATNTIDALLAGK